MVEPRRGRLWAGGIVWLTSAQFFLAQALAQFSWKGSRPYSLRHSWISDLGAVTCRRYSGGGGILVCSPRHDLFNAALFLLAAQIVVGAVFLHSMLARTWLGHGALGLLTVSGVAVAFVGAFPEDTGKPWHAVAAAVHFAAAGLGMLIVGFALRREGRNGLCYLSLLTGGVSLCGTLLTAAQLGAGVGRASVERAAAWPFTIWTTLVGAAVIASLARSRSARFSAAVA